MKALATCNSSSVSLRHLFLDGCTGVGDDVVEALLEKCSNLKILSVTGTEQESGVLTNRVLEAIQRLFSLGSTGTMTGTKLRHIYLSGQRGLTGKSLASLRKSTNGLTIHCDNTKKGSLLRPFSSFVVSNADEWEREQCRRKTAAGASLSGSSLEERIRKLTSNGLSDKTHLLRHQYFERQWAKFLKAVELVPMTGARGTGKLITAEFFRWPSSESDLLSSNCVGRRARLRELRLRWHPDKFYQRYHHAIHPDHLESVMRSVTGVFQIVSEAKGRS